MQTKTTIQAILVGLCVLAAMMICIQSAQATPPSGTSWALYYADEFGGDSVDTQKWITQYPWGPTHNASSSAYALPQNLSVANGVLTETGKRETAPDGKQFTTGVISTGYDKLMYTYGYAEARIKLPTTPGSFPAFWGLYYGWPPESDIMEYPIFTSDMNYDQYYISYHYVGSGGNAAYGGWANPSSAGNLTTDFHTYGMEWTSSYIKYYFDGTVMRTVTDTAAISQMVSMYLILNYSIGGGTNNWPTTPDTTQWPVGHTDTTQVDWVRVWKNTSGYSSTTWTLAGNGDWNTAGNWSSGSPQIGTQTATFGSVAASSVTVDWTNSRTVGGLVFNSSVNYTLGNGNESLMLTSATPITSDQPNSTTVYINANSASGSSPNIINSRLELYNNVTIRSSGKPLTINGTIIGLGGLRIESGAVTLNNVSSYSGLTAVTGGTVTLSSNGTLGGGSANVELGYESSNVVSVIMNSVNAKIKASVVRLGYGLNSQTTLTQTLGSVTSTGDMYVGANGQASYGMYNNSTLSTGGKLILGNAASANGSITQTNGTVNIGTSTTSSPWASIGESGTGAYTINAGTLNAYTTSGFNVGKQTTSSGTFNINGGTVNLRDLFLAKYGSAQGTATQTGGTVNITLSGGSTDNVIGGYDSSASNAQGTYGISNGYLTVSQNLQIGGYGHGLLNQSGGTIYVSQNPSLGRYSTGIGELNVSGGTFSQNYDGARLVVGQEGTGTLTVNGSGIVNSAGGLRIGAASTALGTVNLNSGGTIIVAFVESLGGTSTWNFNGGTLKVRAASTATFMQGLTNAYVNSGGAVIDTNTYDITIAQSLLDGGGGLTKNSSGTLTLSGNNTYAGTTAVSAGAMIISGAAVSIGSATIADGASLQVNSLSASMHDISGLGSLIVGDGSSLAQLTVDSVVLSSLRLGAGSKLILRSSSGTPLAGDMTPVPEPSSLILLTLAGAMLFIARRKKIARQ